jgi:hypothetical protein
MRVIGLLLLVLLLARCSNPASPPVAAEPAPGTIVPRIGASMNVGVGIGGVP